MKNLIKKHYEIENLLNILMINPNNYSLGEYDDNKVCVIDSNGGYLVFTGKYGQRLNPIIVMDTTGVVNEIQSRLYKSLTLKRNIK